MPDHDQISESTQYIQESTVVPESMAAHLPDNDMPESAVEYDLDAEDDDGLPGGQAEGLKKPKAKGGGSKKVMIGAVLAVVVVVGGLIVFKKQSVQAQQAEMAAAAQAAQAAQAQAPVQVPTPMPTPEASQPPIPVDQLPAQVQLPSQVSSAPTGSATAQTDQPVGNPRGGTAEQSLGESHSSVMQSGKGEKAGVKGAEDGAKSRELQASLRAEQERSRTLEQRLAHLEAMLSKQQPTETRQPRQAEPEAQVPTAVVKKVVKKASARSVAKATSKAKTKVVSEKQAAKPSVSPAVLAQYRVTAVRNGVAWLETPSGLTAVRIGDDVEGIGAVTAIDEDRGTVTAAGYKLN